MLGAGGLDLAVFCSRASWERQRLGSVTVVARDRLRTENDLREAEELIGRVRGVSVDDAAQALKDQADVMGVPVVDVARAVISGRADMSPMPSGAGHTATPPPTSSPG